MRTHRTKLGRRFTEGARLFWIAIEAQGLSIAAASKRLKRSRGHISNVLYGDRLPGVGLAAAIEKAFGVKGGAWACESTAAFLPPAARVPQAA